MRARHGLIVSIALSYAAAKGSAYETQDTSFTFDVSDFGLAPELSEGLGSDDAAVSADTCFDGRCRDSPTYMSIMSLPCHEHTFFDCALFIDVGFTQEQVDELIESCPCSCNVACPDEPVVHATSTPSPTSKPSVSPVSNPPTKSPSASPVSDPPTASPSAAPVSDPPTKSPSASPVSDPPTKNPSSSPVSDSPTRFPSMSPVTSNPTPLPSAAPITPSPTPRPSKAPVSPRPTASPTAAKYMSTTTRITPMNLGAEATCPPGYSGLTPTPECSGVIHCSNGVKIFGPIPCLNGPNGALVFDIDKKMCVLNTDDFVCRLPTTSVPDTAAPSRLPTRLPTLSPSASPVTPNPTTMPPTKSPTVRPSADTTDQPSKALPVKYDEEVVDISISSTPKIAAPGEEKNDAPNFVASERSFWNTSIIPSNESSMAFTPLIIGAIAGAGVLAVVFAAAMFGQGQKIFHKRSRMNRGPEVNIRPGEKFQIDNMDDVMGSKKSEEAGFAGLLMDAIFGSGVGDEKATMGPDGGGSTIVSSTMLSRASVRSAGSKINSIIKSVTSKESTKKVLESIKMVRQKTFEATENPAKAVKEATRRSASDVSNLGDHVFSCASDVLCLPNNLKQPKRNSRTFNGRVPYKPKNLEEAFFDDDISNSVYEDV